MRLPMWTLINSCTESLYTCFAQLNLFCSGSPLEDEMQLAALSGLNIDLSVPLLGGKVRSQYCI